MRALGDIGGARNCAHYLPGGLSVAESAVAPVKTSRVGPVLPKARQQDK